MVNDERILNPLPIEADASTAKDQMDRAVRPLSLQEFVGQKAVKHNLSIFVTAAKNRGDAMDHVLFYGPPGLGKTTLAQIVSKELGVGFRSTSGPVIARAGDLAALLTNLQERDVLFIDEIHRLNPAVEEILYPAMEDYQLDILIGQGPSAKSIKLNLPQFTLIGATTRAGLLTSPLRDRFGVVMRLDFYSPEELSQIVMRSCKILNLKIDQEGAFEIAKRSRGTPRIVNRLLKRVRDFAEIKAQGIVTLQVAKDALKMLEVDEAGFDHMDRRILLTLIQKFSGGPVGLETLSSSIGEEKDTIEDVYEPYLIQEGYLNRTPRGRIATDKAYLHFGLPLKEKEQGILL